MKTLINKHFKRKTISGISFFIGIIKEVFVVYEMKEKPIKHSIPHIKIKSENGIVYDLCEIIIIN